MKIIYSLAKLCFAKRVGANHDSPVGRKLSLTLFAQGIIACTPRLLNAALALLLVAKVTKTAGVAIPPHP